METDPPQVYFPLRISFPNTSDDSKYVEFTQGELALFMNFVRNGSLFSSSRSAVNMQCLRFESDGHLRVPLSCAASQFQSFLEVPGSLTSPTGKIPKAPRILEIQMRRAAKRFARTTARAELLFFNMKMAIVLPVHATSYLRYFRL